MKTNCFIPLYSICPISAVQQNSTTKNPVDLITIESSSSSSSSCRRSICGHRYSFTLQLVLVFLIAVTSPQFFTWSTAFVPSILGTKSFEGPFIGKSSSLAKQLLSSSFSTVETTDMTSSCTSGTTTTTTTNGNTASSCCGPSKTSATSSSETVTTKIDETKTPLFLDKTNEEVQNYYGKQLQTSDDLKTNACTTGVSMPDYIKRALSNIHPIVLSKYYGCGLCIPDYDLTGCHVLDLGCGAGRDVYLTSQLVGPTGRVVGIDMTVEQLEVANKYKDYHAQAFGHKASNSEDEYKSNVVFLQGYLEKLNEISELEPESFDLIISNCVINLCTDKLAVLKSCYNLLKEGGELYFSDVYSNRRVPESLQRDPTLWGECLSGALYWNDFHNMAKQAGFKDPRLVDDKPITINNNAVRATIERTGNGNIEFYSATYRLQKLNNLEPACEDYGQAVIYKGTINADTISNNLNQRLSGTGGGGGSTSSSWTLDKHHTFETGRVFPVCGNTWNMLKGNTRIASHFDYIGNFDKHFGIFEGCGSSLPYDRSSISGSSTTNGSSGGCC